jgi:hypothetical protein
MKPTDIPPPAPLDSMDGWLGGDLSPGSEEERALLATAADEASAASLSAEVAAHRALRAQVRSLEVEVAPERDLWPPIEARIGAGHPGSWASRGLWARRLSMPAWAALAALLAVGVGTALLLRERPVRVEAPPRVVSLPSPAAPRPVVLAAYAKTDRQLDAVRAELWRSIEAHQEKLPPETRAVVFANLRTIERAIAEIEAALAQSPADDELARTYIAYRERQIAVLRQANQLAARL